MIYDAKHHEVSVRLLRSIGLESVESSEDEDIASIADRFIINDPKLPVGMKRRGANSGNDFNLSAWSHANGLLPEFATAGNKLYLYWMQDRHVLIEFPDQAVLDTLQPDQWTPITDGRSFKKITECAWVRAESVASKVQQGVIFVPSHMVTVLAEWDLNENQVISPRSTAAMNSARSYSCVAGRIVTSS